MNYNMKLEENEIMLENVHNWLLLYYHHSAVIAIKNQQKDSEAFDKLFNIINYETTDHTIDETTEHMVDETTEHTIDETTEHTIDETTDHKVDETTDHKVDETTEHMVDETTDHKVDNILKKLTKKHLKRGPKSEKYKLKNVIKYDELKNFFGFTQKDAANKLQINLSTLKKLCKANNIKKWPYKKLKIK